MTIDFARKRLRIRWRESNKNLLKHEFVRRRMRDLNNGRYLRSIDGTWHVIKLWGWEDTLDDRFIDWKPGKRELCPVDVSCFWNITKIGLRIEEKRKTSRSMTLLVSSFAVLCLVPHCRLPECVDEAETPESEQTEINFRFVGKDRFSRDLLSTTC